MPKQAASKLPKGFKRPEFAPTWKPEKVGDMLQGILRRVRNVKTTHGVSTLYTIVTEDGNMDVWDSAGLRDLGNVGLGQEVCIVYMGEKKIARQPNPLRVYEIGVR